MQKIRIKDIKPEGSIFEDFITPEVIAGTEVSAGEEKDEYSFVAPVHVKAKLEHVGKEILARVNLFGVYTMTCSRCLEEAQKNFNKDVALIYEVDRNDESVDLEDDLRQEVIVSMPLRVLCQDDCKGLCPGCGGNLNQNNCSCEKKIN